MRQFTSISRLAGVWAVLLCACGGRPAVLEQPRDVAGPIVVGPHVVYLDQSLERVTLVRPYTREIQQIRVGRSPYFMMPTPDRAQLLVVCKGWVATTREEVDAPPSLYRIDPETGESREYLLGSPFDEVAVSPDSRYAVAFFSATAAPGPQEVFRNPNAVAILDLAAADDATVMEKTVRSFGDVPLGVVFSPADMAPIRADGTPGTGRTLAVVFADGYITFLDVTQPHRSEITVHLTLPGSGETVIPAEMVFAPRSGTVFLRASGSNDIFAFTLTERQASGSQNDFVISINTLAAGTVPADVSVFDLAGERKILVANRGSYDLSLIDAKTSEFVTIAVGDPVDRVLLYPEVHPYMAVVVSRASPRSRIHFLDLEDVAERRGQNLAVLETADPVTDISLVPGRNQALVEHSSDRSVLSVLDLDERTLAPITAHGPLQGFVFAEGGGLIAGFSTDRDRLGTIDLGNLATRTVQLSFDAQSVLSLYPAEGPGTDPEHNTVVITHADPAGLITVIPDPRHADRASMYVMSGFLLQGALDAEYSSWRTP